MALHGSSSSGAAAAASFPNRVFSDTLVNASTTTLIPPDATIPQVTEGQEFLTATLTPTSASARVRVEVDFFCQVSLANNNSTAALFINGAANAVSASSVFMATASGGVVLRLAYEYVPGSTTPQVLSVRAGPGTSGTLTPNLPTFGGVNKSSIRAFEIA